MGELIINLKGGIGNQLFQYALARKLELLFETEVKYNISSFDNDAYKRKPSLIDLKPSLKEALATIKEGDVEVLTLTDGFFADSDLRKITPLLRCEQRKTILLDGYWQSLDTVDDALINELFVDLKEYAKSRVENFSQVEAECLKRVGVHFRRSDYKHHGLVKDSYYQSIFLFLRRRNSAESFAVFSDELNSVRYLLTKRGFDYLFVHSSSELVDLTLFSSCKSHVIANSTFSWWGARLATRTRKVFYPLPWTLMYNQQTPLFPSNWCRIDNALETEDNSNVPVTHEQVEYSNYVSDEIDYFAQEDGIMGKRERMFCPGDSTTTQSFDAHYVYHTAWAARRLFENPVECHLDIASDLRFVTIASAFQKMIYADYRPPSMNLGNLAVQKVDLTALVYADNSFDSISCMHVVEHIGLGRYGDSLNPKGSEIAARELVRILRPGGLLYFVVPVGQPRVVFHAHRIFSTKMVMEMFRDFSLIDFSLITDQGNFIENAGLDAAEEETYACGCFLLRKYSGS